MLKIIGKSWKFPFSISSKDSSLAFTKIERIFNQVNQADKFQNVEDGKGIALFWTNATISDQLGSRERWVEIAQPKSISGS